MESEMSFQSTWVLEFVLYGEWSHGEFWFSKAFLASNSEKVDPHVHVCAACDLIRKLSWVNACGGEEEEEEGDKHFVIESFDKSRTNLIALKQKCKPKVTGLAVKLKNFQRDLHQKQSLLAIRNKSIQPLVNLIPS